jgi:diguanylate cyclase (GGDEF)-like protein
LAHCEAGIHPAGASTDPATGLLDGVAFFASADAAIQEAAASGTALSFLLIEVFCLHQISNQLGRAAGARILNEFAQRLRTAFRGSDVIGRLGSEEFAVLAVGAVSGALASRANNLAENLTKIFSSLCPDIGVTAAVGVAEMPQDGHSLEELLATAEARLHSSDLAKLCQVTAERPAGPATVGPTAAFSPARNLLSVSE